MTKSDIKTPISTQSQISLTSVTSTPSTPNTPSEKQVGVIFGKFFPLHKGHLYMIDVAASELDELHVFVCTDEQRDARLFLDSSLVVRPTREQRTSWLAYAMQNKDKVFVHNLQEDNIPTYPNGWEQWANRVREKWAELGISPTKVYTSEPQDVENYKTYLDLEGILVDPNRGFIHISGTECRKKLFDNFEYVADFLHKDLALNVILNISKKANNFDKHHLEIERILKSFAQKYGITYFTSAGFEHCHFANSKIILTKDKMDMVDYHNRDLHHKFGTQMQSMKPLNSDESVALIKQPVVSFVVDLELGGYYRNGKYDVLPAPETSKETLTGIFNSGITINPKFTEFMSTEVKLRTIQDLEVPLLKAIYACINNLQKPLSDE